MYIVQFIGYAVGSDYTAFALAFASHPVDVVTAVAVAVASRPVDVVTAVAVAVASALENIQRLSCAGLDHKGAHSCPVLALHLLAAAAAAAAVPEKGKAAVYSPAA